MTDLSQDGQDVSARASRPFEDPVFTAVRGIVAENYADRKSTSPDEEIVYSDGHFIRAE